MAKKRSVTKKAEKEMKTMGLDHKKIVGVILGVVGILLVIGNIGSALLAIVGFVLIYFGLWLFGYKISLSSILNS